MLIHAPRSTTSVLGRTFHRSAFRRLVQIVINPSPRSLIDMAITRLSTSSYKRHIPGGYRRGANGMLRRNSSRLETSTAAQWTIGGRIWDVVIPDPMRRVWKWIKDASKLNLSPAAEDCNAGLPPPPPDPVHYNLELTTLPSEDELRQRANKVFMEQRAKLMANKEVVDSYSMQNIQVGRALGEYWPYAHMYHEIRKSRHKLFLYPSHVPPKKGEETQEDREKWEEFEQRRRTRIKLNKRLRAKQIENEKAKVEEKRSRLQEALQRRRELRWRMEEAKRNRRAFIPISPTNPNVERTPFLLPSEVAVKELIDHHESLWLLLKSNVAVSLSTESVPWPLLRCPQSPEDFSKEEIATFVFHPIRLKLDKMKRCFTNMSRYKNHRLDVEFLRWRPDRFQLKILPRVPPEQKEVIAQYGELVYKALTSLREDCKYQRTYLGLGL